MTTKNELAEQLVAAGILPPENWGKLSTARAEAFVKAALNVGSGAEAPKPKKVGIIGHAKAGLMAVGAALAGMGGAVVGPVVEIEPTPAPAPAKLDKAARKNAKMKVFSDPKYRKTTNRMRRFMANNRPAAPVVVPENPSRQVRRAMERRADKMPVGASQAVWHKAQGFGKIGLGKRG